MKSEKKIGIVLSYLSQGIQILSGVVYTPIMLRLLGQSEYGLYQLVYSVVSYLSLLSFGFSSSYMRFYSRAKVKDDEIEVARLNGMFLTIFLIISIICILCGAVMIKNIESIFSTGLQEAEYFTARILMAFMVFNLALTFPNSVFDAFTSAHERFQFQKVLLIMQNVLNPFLSFPLLLLGYGSIGMVLVTSFLTIGKFVVNIWFSLQKLQIKFIFYDFDFRLLKEMWVFTFFIFLNEVINQINWSVDKFLLGRFAGTVAVAIYGLGGQINSMYLQFSTSISGVFIPSVNSIVATNNDNKELTELFTKIGRIQFIILGLIFTGFIFFGKPFMRFWGGKGYEESYYVSLWLILPVTIPLIQNLGIEIQRAKNMHKARSIVYLLIAMINVFISIPLIKYFGTVGAAVGTAFSLLVGNGLFMNWYYHYRIGLDVGYFWKNIISFLPGLILPVVYGVFNMLIITYDSLLKLGMGIAAYSGIFGFFMYFWGMNMYEKNLVRGMFKRFLKVGD